MLIFALWSKLKQVIDKNVYFNNFITLNIKQLKRRWADYCNKKPYSLVSLVDVTLPFTSPDLQFLQPDPGYRIGSTVPVSKLSDPDGPTLI